MRLSKLILIFAICSSSAFGQSEATSIISDLMNIVEPEFIETNENKEIKDFIEENLQIPLNAQKWGMEGTAVIRFTVLPTQNLSEFHIIHSVSPGLDEAVMDVLEASNGMWKPGTIYGRPVPMEKEVTVIFKIEGADILQTAQMNKIQADEFLKKGKYSRAIKLYSKSVGTCPNYEISIYRRGLARFYSGDLEGAMHDFERVADLDSHLADLMLTKLNEVANCAESELQLSALIY